MEKKIEDYNNEFKIDIPEKSNRLKAEIVSFLNARGGNIYLGVNDEGNVDIELIQKKKHEWEKTLSNWINNAFSPEVANLISVFGNEIPFRIKVSEGNDKPYFYKDGEGFNSKGVYVRIGSTKRVASFDEIQRMIKQKFSNGFETTTIKEKNLTFNYLKNRFREHGLKFNKYALSLVDQDGNYNNAALLFSDQNPTVTKFAVFQGKTVKVFLDKREFRGPIIKQLDEVLDFAKLLNRKRITFSGKPERDEFLDFPTDALREAIINCYCHRDYTLSGDIKVELYDDRMQIFSPGGLPDGLSFDNIRKGIVAKRNKIIVNVLDKIDIIENYASGIRRIFDDYAGFTKQPEYYISENGIIVTLFNRNYDSQNPKNDSQSFENDSQNSSNDTQNPKNDSQSFENDSQNSSNDTQNPKNDSQKSENDTQNPKNDSQSFENDSQNSSNDTQNPKNDSQKSENDTQKLKLSAKQRRNEIINLISNKKNITSLEIKDILNISAATMNRDLKQLREENRIEYIGSSKNGYWLIKTNKEDNK